MKILAPPIYSGKSHKKKLKRKLQRALNDDDNLQKFLKLDPVSDCYVLSESLSFLTPNLLKNDDGEVDELQDDDFLNPQSNDSRDGSEDGLRNVTSLQQLLDLHDKKEEENQKRIQNSQQEKELQNYLNGKNDDKNDDDTLQKLTKSTDNFDDFEITYLPSTSEAYSSTSTTLNCTASSNGTTTSSNGTVDIKSEGISESMPILMSQKRQSNQNPHNHTRTSTEPFTVYTVPYRRRSGTSTITKPFDVSSIYSNPKKDLDMERISNWTNALKNLAEIDRYLNQSNRKMELNNDNSVTFRSRLPDEDGSNTFLLSMINDLRQ